MLPGVDLPSDLVPLPTQPWDERPDELPIDREEARTAIWKTKGNITDAAELLKVRPGRLRALVKTSEYLRREVEEAGERLVDMAETVVEEALRDPERSDPMARFVLASKGKNRGWGQGSGGVSLNLPKGPIQITWADGSSINSVQPGDDAKVVDAEVIDG